MAGQPRSALVVALRDALALAGLLLAILLVVATAFPLPWGGGIALNHVQGHGHSGAVGAPHGDLATRSLTGTDTAPPRDKCLIFYHIPKTGGTTLTHVLIKGGLRIWKYHETKEARLQDFKAPPASTLKGKLRKKGHATFHYADVYKGHWSFDTKYFFQKSFGMHRDCYEATMLREPLSRELSAYIETHQDKTNYTDLCRDVVQSKNQPRVGGQLNRIMSGREGGLEKAKEVLCRLDAVLLFPDMDKLYGVIARIFDGTFKPPKPNKIPHKRHRTLASFQTLPRDCQDALASVYRSDIELWEWASRTFANKTPC